MTEAENQQQQMLVVQRNAPRIEPPGEIVLDCERESNFRRFKSRWESYYILSRLGDEEVDYQRALLMYTMGDNAARVVESSDRYRTDRSLDAILEVLEQYCIGETNVVHERYKFNIRNQLPNETFDAFYTDLRSLVDKCGFNYRPAVDGGVPPLDEMLRDRIVLGIADDTVRKRLISQGNNLSLAEAVRVCRSNEVTSTIMQSVAKSTGAGAVDAVAQGQGDTAQGHRKPGQTTRRRDYADSNATQQKPHTLSNGPRCSRCGRQPLHARRDCPAGEAKCRKCGKVGHWQVQCRSKSIREAEIDEEFLFNGELCINQVTQDAWKATVEVNGNDTTFKLDTGADGTIISDQEPWLQHQQLKGTSVALLGPGRKRLPILGTLRAQMTYKGRSLTETAYVIKDQPVSLLSRDACEKLNLVTCHVKNQLEVAKDIRAGFPKLFKGLGLLRDYSYRISLRDDCKPVCIFTPRKIPLPLREKTKSKLDEMVQQGVISQMTEATDWCSGMVPVLKPSGEVRICVDLTGLNKAVRREVYPMPSVDESIALLGSSKVFSKLDANSGFWQISLDEDSRRLTTFLTPFGRFCYNRLPFGISSAPEIFSRAMSELLGGLDNVICHMDDVLVHGKDTESHDKSLRKVLTRLEQAGLTLNESKCEIAKTSVKFLGHLIDANGVSADPAKIKAIQDYPAPTNKTELRRVNGMLNQLSRFIPHLSSLNAPMRTLLKENRTWIWGPPQEEAFQRIKEMLTSTEVMSHYDPSLHTTVSTDASQYGLGATMFQTQKDGTRRPVYYASRSLTDTERNYAVIEKEALAMAWACDKLDQFLRGLSFTLETDHKPLVQLMNVKDLDQVPARVLRMRLRLMRYAPKVEYVQGSQNHLPDALSRAPVDGPSDTDTAFISELNICASSLIMEDPIINRIRDAQSSDPICQEVLKSIRLGWPTYKTDANSAIHPYWDVKGHFTEVDGILVFDQRIVIPSAMQLEILEQIHQAHQGITKCLGRARRSVWWPGMSSQIKSVVQNCRQCKINSPAPVEPLNPSTFPERAWSRVGADLFEFRKQNYLLVVDYYSRYIEVRRLDSLAAAATIDKLKAIFCTHGVPEVMISDNGPQFGCREFGDFARQYGFQHITSSPRYPKSNGEAERAVGTVKRMWAKTDDPYMSLMIYRATPLENGFAPSELLMGRLLRTALPTLPGQHALQKDRGTVMDKERQIKERTMKNYDN